jgi:hypothetical protein
MSEHDAAGFEAPHYPAKTYTQVYLDSVFRNAVAIRGANHEYVQVDTSDPVIEAEMWGVEAEGEQLTLTGEGLISNGYRNAHESVTSPNGELTVSGLLTQRYDYNDIFTPVEPSRIGATLTTSAGSVTLDILMPSEYHVDDDMRPRDSEELLPPRAKVSVFGGEGVFMEDLLEIAATESGELRERHAAAVRALQSLAIRTEAPDWPDGSYKLTATDMELVMDFMCNFWDVVDPRKRYPDWNTFWQSQGTGTTPVPDHNWRPYSARQAQAPHTPKHRATDQSKQRPVNIKFPSQIYGMPAAERQAAEERGDEHTLGGLWRFLNIRRRHQQ